MQGLGAEVVAVPQPPQFRWGLQAPGQLQPGDRDVPVRAAFMDTPWKSHPEQLQVLALLTPQMFVEWCCSSWDSLVLY